MQPVRALSGIPVPELRRSQHYHQPWRDSEPLSVLCTALPQQSDLPASDLLRGLFPLGGPELSTVGDLVG